MYYSNLLRMRPCKAFSFQWLMSHKSLESYFWSKHKIVITVAVVIDKVPEGYKDMKWYNY